jgi:uncharacterized protein involved in exopolysaccharide biosynthesis
MEEYIIMFNLFKKSVEKKAQLQADRKEIFGDLKESINEGIGYTNDLQDDIQKLMKITDEMKQLNIENRVARNTETEYETNTNLYKEMLSCINKLKESEGEQNEYS